MSALDLIPDAESEPVTKPPTRWRNWWRALSDAVRICGGPEFPCGAVFHDKAIYASRDLAETAAAKLVSDAVAAGVIIEKHLAHLGAFPEGERP